MCNNEDSRRDKSRLGKTPAFLDDTNRRRSSIDYTSLLILIDKCTTSLMNMSKDVISFSKALGDTNLSLCASNNLPPPRHRRPFPYSLS